MHKRRACSLQRVSEDKFFQCAIERRERVEAHDAKGSTKSGVSRTRSASAVRLSDWIRTTLSKSRRADEIAIATRMCGACAMQLTEIRASTTDPMVGRARNGGKRVAIEIRSCSVSSCRSQNAILMQLSTHNAANNTKGTIGTPVIPSDAATPAAKSAPTAISFTGITLQIRLKKWFKVR